MRKEEKVGGLTVFCQVHMNWKSETRRVHHRGTHDDIDVQVYSHKIEAGYGTTVLETRFTEKESEVVTIAENLFKEAKKFLQTTKEPRKPITQDKLQQLGYK
jgi:hypothetical protein